ncbi:MAG: ribonuclease H-like domain-containing protein [Deltaproteobacteria bacterium]|nr:ribonuclease H-like domain-containing protein [Deltaproteobacteria bacterium]
MLENTFIHITGIGPKTEQLLWNRGIRTWQDFLDHKKPVFSQERDSAIKRELENSLENRNNLRHFVQSLPPSDLWRVYETFQSQAVFLDIETSGGYQGLDEITVIGLYDGRRVQTFVNGRNLDDFEQALTSSSLVITFNGSCFDLPYLRRWFRHIELPSAHIDLRFVLRKLGLRGGLKSIEEQVGLFRDPAVKGLNGFDAVLLWKDYQWGDESALERLILYNTMDIVQLKPLMELGVRELKKRLLAF